MALEHERLSVREKVGYGIGDAAANFIFQTMIIFQLAFYTDTFGITAAAAGTLFLVVRVFDAAFDPLMGVIADRTNTRWGKFRPWILWTAVPFGIMGFLAFTTPDLSPSGKLAYAYVTYILLMMVYSANNLPYSALSGVMTGDVVQRTSLSSYRMVFAMASQLVIQGLALPMVKQFGGGNSVTETGTEAWGEPGSRSEALQRDRGAEDRRRDRRHQAMGRKSVFAVRILC
jgi:Na+/melibiose symporter-like transporter